ncbi:MAG: carbohydrate kinase family protein [Lachnospiraceae bacterium]|nr:carbohydrate kinase family protein [Lachnospiraceae bacterium]
MENEEKFITVIGGSNIDIGGKPFNKPIARDSNPGTVSTTLGGVGRNMAQDLALLGRRVRFITALGNDAHGQRLSDDLTRLGIDFSESYRSARGESTSTYLYITDETGDMELAIADMAIFENLTLDFFISKLPAIDNSQIVILDANLPPDTIRELCSQIKAPVFAETVSYNKAVHIKEALPHLTLTAPNALEAEILSGVPVDATDKRSVERAADALLNTGLKNVVITMGGAGAYFANGFERGFLPSLPTRHINTTGAGDALMAGIAACISKGISLKDSVRLGIAAASMTIETEWTCNEAMTFDSVCERAGLDINDN